MGEIKLEIRKIIEIMPKDAVQVVEPSSSSSSEDDSSEDDSNAPPTEWTHSDAPPTEWASPSPSVRSFVEQERRARTFVEQERKSTSVEEQHRRLEASMISQKKMRKLRREILEKAERRSYLVLDAQKYSVGLDFIPFNFAVPPEFMGEPTSVEDDHAEGQWMRAWKRAG